MAGIYIHIPFCRDACHYCDFHFTINYSKTDEMVDAICREISLRKSYLDQQKLNELEDELGFRILMTNRHNWDTVDIIKTYYGQSQIEHTFRNLKNPYHLAVRPPFHWTDQKIIVHNFICVLGYLLSAIIFRQAKMRIGFNGTMDTLLDSLNDIRLAAVLSQSDSPGPAKASYQLEQMSESQQQLMCALGIEKIHMYRPRFNSVGVYKDR